MWPTDTVELVALDVDGQHWAIPLDRVERVVATVAVAALPASPAGVRGAINVGGEAVPVLDLDLRAGREPRDRGLAGRLVLARTSRRRVALTVDLVLGVVAVDAGAISPLADDSPGPFAGVVALPDGVLAIYDLEAFLSAADEDALTAALEGVPALTATGDVLTQARELVRERLGLDFPARRLADLERALQATGTAPDALRELADGDEAWQSFIAALTVQESYFFRDPALFTALADDVLPQLIAAARARRNRRLTIWSAGCAEGQEPYSIAMLLDRALPDRAGWSITILATDLNAHALAAARTGLYSDWALRALPAWARTHFTPAGRGHALSAHVREAVQFARLNLATDPYPGSIDLIVCRNVLMYLTDEVRTDAVARLAGALAPGGWLALSPLDSTPGHEPAGTEPEHHYGVRLLRARGVEAASASARRGDDAAREGGESVRGAGEARRGAGAPVRTEQALPLLERARAAADGGAFEAALVLCGDALREDPLNADAHLLAAAVEEERGNPGAAIQAVRRAIYSEPDCAEAHFRLGALLLRRGDELLARRSIDTARELIGS